MYVKEYSQSCRYPHKQKLSHSGVCKSKAEQMPPKAAFMNGDHVLCFYFTPKVYASGSCAALLEQCILALILFHSQPSPGAVY